MQAVLKIKNEEAPKDGVYISQNSSNYIKVVAFFIYKLYFNKIGFFKSNVRVSG